MTWLIISNDWIKAVYVKTKYQGLKVRGQGKDLKLEDKVKDLWSEEKHKELKSRDQGKRQGLVNWSSRILKDKDFPR